MNWSAFVRQFHRWLSIAFTVTVIANFAFMALGGVSLWVTYSPLDGVTGRTPTIG
jgi:hypothetical protein